MPFLPVFVSRNGSTYEAGELPGDVSGYGRGYTEGAGARLSEDFETHVFMVPYDS